MPDVTTGLHDWTRVGQPLGGMEPGGLDDIKVPPLAGWIAWRLRDILEQLRKRKWYPLPPPVPGPGQEKWAAAVAVLLGRAVAEQAIRFTLEAEFGGTAKSAAARFVSAFVDDYCGTPPRRKLPLPRGIDIVLGPPELLLIAGQLQAGATLGGGEALTTAAQKIARHAGG